MAAAICQWRAKTSNALPKMFFLSFRTLAAQNASLNMAARAGTMWWYLRINLHLTS